MSRIGEKVTILRGGYRGETGTIVNRDSNGRLPVVVFVQIGNQTHAFWEGDVSTKNQTILKRCK